ncbi:MAG: peptidase E [Actinomycetota bacterium]|nr:peptidase E [Actinomycetota bacterium]
MSADTPTILATSGGLVAGRRIRWELGPLTEFAIDLAGTDARAPSVCFLATAVGDNPSAVYSFYEAAQHRGLRASHVALFPMPNLDDVRSHLLAQDVIWVNGGSVAGLLAMWRIHGLDDIMREAWQAGVVLTGASAGSICWHVGGTTDSYGPELRPITDGLAFLPYSNGVHYDSEDQRRPLFQALIADAVLPAGYATEDGVGLLYHGSQLAEALTEVEGKAAYRVARDTQGRVLEERIEPRLLT